jgi:hypothetical protein
MALKTHTIKVETGHLNFSTFGLIFTAKKFLGAARTVVAQESQEDGGWHPVGKYLACHSVELSLKAFLTLNGEKMDSVRKRFSHRIAELLVEADKLKLEGLVKLTDAECAEIKKAAAYYAGKVFEYPAVFEAGKAYPGDPDASYLLSAADKLVDGLYQPCMAAA